jgi:hypothetical protein
MIPSRMRALTAGTLLLGGLLMFGGRDSRSVPQDGTKTIKVRVSVTDPLNRFVADLDQKQFKISAGKAQQTITYFAHKSAPVSAVFVFDLGIPEHRVRNEYYQVGADSMRRTMARLLQPGIPIQQLVLILFDAKSARIETFTREGSTAKDAPLARGGSSALIAAIRMGLDQVKSLSGEKKALIVITTSTNALEFEIPPKPDFQIFAIATTGKAELGMKIPGIYDQTGGREYIISNYDQLDYYVDLIRDEMQSEYVLGFVPSSGNVDLKRIKVDVSRPPGLPKLAVHTHALP